MSIVGLCLMIELDMLISAQVLYAFLYVAPFYISSTTRPSPQLSRDAPSVIRGRISTVTLSCIICSVSTFVLLASVEHGGPLLALHSMGYLPPGFSEAAKCMVLTSILFLGPLFEAAIVEGAWRDWICLRGAGELFSSWMGYRNLVAVSSLFLKLILRPRLLTFIGPYNRRSPVQICRSATLSLVKGSAQNGHFWDSHNIRTCSYPSLL
jgi:hypothetical protein